MRIGHPKQWKALPKSERHAPAPIAATPGPKMLPLNTRRGRPAEGYHGMGLRPPKMPLGKMIDDADKPKPAPPPPPPPEPAPQQPAIETLHQALDGLRGRYQTVSAELARLAELESEKQELNRQIEIIEKARVQIIEQAPKR